MKFIAFSGIDPFSDKDGASNTIYVRPDNIYHIEQYTGPFQLQAYGPDGKLVYTGKFKQIIGGSLLWLAVGGQRIVTESPATVLETINGPGFDT